MQTNYFVNFENETIMLTSEKCRIFHKNFFAKMRFGHFFFVQIRQLKKTF